MCSLSVMHVHIAYYQPALAEVSEIPPGFVKTGELGGESRGEAVEAVPTERVCSSVGAPTGVCMDEHWKCQGLSAQCSSFSPGAGCCVCVCDLATRVAEVLGQLGSGGITCAKLTLPEVSLEGSG